MKIYEISLEPQRVWEMLCLAMSVHGIDNSLDQKTIEKAFRSANLSKMECYPWNEVINTKEFLVDLTSQMHDAMLSNPDQLVYLMQGLLFILLRMDLLDNAHLTEFLNQYEKFKHEIFSNSTPISLKIIPKLSASLVGKTYISHVGDTVTFLDKVLIFPNTEIRVLSEDSIYTMEYNSKRINLLLSKENVVQKTWEG